MIRVYWVSGYFTLGFGVGDKNGEPLGSSILGSNAILLFWYIARVICWKQNGIQVSLILFTRKQNYLEQFLTKQKSDKALEPFSILHTPYISFVIPPLGNSTSQFQTPVKKWRPLSIYKYTQLRDLKSFFCLLTDKLTWFMSEKHPLVFTSTYVLQYFYYWY